MADLNTHYFGTNSQKLEQNVLFLLDSSIGPSGAFRAASTADFAGGSGAASSNLNFDTDSISIYPPFSDTAFQGVGTENVTVFLAGRDNMRRIQNIGTTPIFVSLKNEASPSNFAFILKGGDELYDGKGDSWSSDSFFGIVAVSGSGINYSYYKY